MVCEDVMGSMVFPEVLAWDGALYAAPQAAANVLRVTHSSAEGAGLHRCLKVHGPWSVMKDHG